MRPNPTFSPERIGFIGIGAMGLPMALRLHEQGHKVTVHDSDPARSALAAQAGCAVAHSPRALAEACELLLVVVVNGAQTREVLLGEQGAAQALRNGAAVMLCPTIAPEDTEAIAAALQALGLPCLDAPLSGGPLRARSGTMSLMVACPDPLFERWQALLQTLATPVFRVGVRPGDGARTKLVNNLLAAANLAAAAEALALAQSLGLDPANTLAVIEQSSGQSWIGSDRLRRALAAEPGVLARVALLAKDSALALRMAERAGQAPAVGAAAAACFARALDAGLADADDSVLCSWLLNGPLTPRWAAAAVQLPPSTESAP